MLKKQLLEKLFSAFSILRWNDHIRPFKLTEQDKQSHKMMIAYLIANDVSQINWVNLIEAEIFELLKNIALTDIKRSVLHKIIKEKNTEVNEFIFNNLKDDLSTLSNDFYQRFIQYFSEKDFYSMEKDVLKAAGLIASHWEFLSIERLNSDFYDTSTTNLRLINELNSYKKYPAVNNYIQMAHAAPNFITTCGLLRFQTRWSQTPRIPETSVLGHLLLTATITYFIMNEVQGSLTEKGLLPLCSRLIINNFFAAIFHDLPEAFTRDIISPVKNNIPGLNDLVKEIESEEMISKLRPLLSPSIFEQMIYYCSDEFACKIKKSNGEIQFITNSKELYQNYNQEEYNPVDGALIRIADEFAAYLEASHSLKHGIISPDLSKAKREYEKKYAQAYFFDFPLQLFFNN